MRRIFPILRTLASELVLLGQTIKEVWSDCTWRDRLTIFPLSLVLTLLFIVAHLIAAIPAPRTWFKQTPNTCHCMEEEDGK